MTDPGIPRLRRASLPVDALLVVRGDDLDSSMTSRHQAEVFRRRYPGWGRRGLSPFYARSEAEIEDLAADRLERFPVLCCFRIADLVEAGLEVWPTFRTPHITIAFTGDLETGLALLARIPRLIRDNPYHEGDGERR